jgi:hypothetical protein
MRRLVVPAALTVLAAAAFGVATVAGGARGGGLSLGVTATPPTVGPGDRLTFKVRVADPQRRAAIRLRQTLPAGFTKLRYRSGTRLSVSGRTVTLRLRRGAGSFTVAGTVESVPRAEISYTIASGGTSARAAARVVTDVFTTTVTTPTTTRTITIEFPPPPPTD